MPELYGNPRKDELRREIRELSKALNAEAKEHRETRQSLEAAQAVVAVLTKKILLLEGKLKDLLTEASQEVSADDIAAEMMQSRQARREAKWATVRAEAKVESA